jgi:anti-sigma B factor antagonist
MRPPSFSFKRPDGFAYDVTRQGDETVVALAGELDMSSAPEFAVCLDRLRASCVATVVVDLTALEFCDSSGLAVFANFQACRAAGDAAGAAPALAAGRAAALVDLSRRPPRSTAAFPRAGPARKLTTAPGGGWPSRPTALEGREGGP